MRLQIKAHHASLSDPVRAYADKRIGKLGKRLHPDTLVELTLGRERNPSIADDHVAEAVVHTKGASIVARESATTYEAAIDELVEKLERQIEKYRDKRRLEPRREAQRRAAAQPEAPLEVEVAPEGESDEAAA
jgi:putative sigma-54 modulation protein